MPTETETYVAALLEALREAGEKVHDNETFNAFCTEFHNEFTKGESNAVPPV